MTRKINFWIILLHRGLSKQIDFKGYTSAGHRPDSMEPATINP